MNIAITGQNGFLGKHLMEKLKKEKIDVTEFDKSKYNLLQPETLQKFVQNKNVIIHIAAVNRDTNFNLLNINVMGTAGLMEAISLYNSKAKVNFTSSYQAYVQDNIYGLSKKLAEEIIKKYATLFGIKSISLRISNIFGP